MSVKRPKGFELLSWDAQQRWIQNAAEELAAKAELHPTAHWASGSSLKCYLVTIDLHTIGKVEQVRTTPYRKVGRLRRDFKPRVEWEERLSPQQERRVVGLYHRTRKRAVYELCLDWLRHYGDCLHAERVNPKSIHPLACGGTGRTAVEGETVNCPECLRVKRDLEEKAR